MKKVNVPGADAGVKNLYINKHRGHVTLVVDGLKLTTRAYYTVQERKNYMLDWANAFKRVGKNQMVYFIIGHYELIRKPRGYVANRPGK